MAGSHQSIVTYLGARPDIDPSTFVADTARVIGNVTIGPGSGIWFGCVLRGDVNSITIGARTNIQDATVIHVNPGDNRTVIGDGVTVGHMALLHACTLETGSFVGMKACVMDGAVVETGAMVAAGALVTNNKRIPAGQLWGGQPARFMRHLTEAEKDHIEKSASSYADLARTYLTPSA